MRLIRSSRYTLLAAFVLSCGSPPPAELPPPAEPPPVAAPSPSEPAADAAPDAEPEGDDTRSEAPVPTPPAAVTASVPADPDDPMVALPEASPARVPGVSAGAIIVSGQLHPSRILVRLRERFDEFRRCHPKGAVGEHVRTGFIIGRDGKVSSIEDAGSTLPDGPAAQCIRTIISKLEFQPPKRGIARVKYSLTLGEP